MNGSPTFRERQVREMAEKVCEANELITRALRRMIPDPRRKVLVNAGQALNAAKVIANEALPQRASTAFGIQGPEVQILPLPLRTGRLTLANAESR
jgi:hypothetical protein